MKSLHDQTAVLEAELDYDLRHACLVNVGLTDRLLVQLVRLLRMSAQAKPMGGTFDVENGNA